MRMYKLLKTGNNINILKKKEVKEMSKIKDYFNKLGNLEAKVFMVLFLFLLVGIVGLVCVTRVEEKEYEQKINKMNTRLDIAHRDIDKLKDQNDFLSNKIQETETDRDEWIQYAYELENSDLSLEIKSLKEEISKKDKKLEARKNQIEELKAELSDYREAEKSVTSGMEQALSRGESYLEYSNFSKKGLKEQLMYEGFSDKEAEYAVNKLF